MIVNTVFQQIQSRQLKKVNSLVNTQKKKKTELVKLTK